MRNMQKINSILTKIKDVVAFRVAKKWICTNFLLANNLSQKYSSKYGAKMVNAKKQWVYNNYANAGLHYFCICAFFLFTYFL